MEPLPHFGCIDLEPLPLQQINYLGWELLMRGKNRRIYGLGIGVNENLQPVISAWLVVLKGAEEDQDTLRLLQGLR